ncbi:MAG TPA: CoA ester lyase [Chloroflexota bacterium]|nr:CoA ester lyase [Chloroflexota bacterium]
MTYVHASNADGWFTVPSRERQFERTSALVRRSSLILPVNVRRFVERAYTRGADAIVLDLEDSVPPREKAAARELVPESIELAGRGGADVMVRINKAFELAVADLDASIHPGLTGIVFPKVESPVEVQIVDRLIAEREMERGLPVGEIEVAVLVETALGVQHMAAIACASPRIVSLSLGSEDFTKDIAVEPSADGEEQEYGKGMTIVAARLAGIQPQGLSSTLANFSDLEGLERSARRAAKIGFKGASCIHPTQVPILNRAYSPDPDAVEYAYRVINVYEETEAAGRASVSLDGKMIDIPIVDRARTLVARAEAIAAREARKQVALAAIAD